MRTVKIFSVLLTFCALTLVPIRAGATISAQISASCPSALGTEDPDADQNKEIAQFFKAKEALFKQDWAGVKTGLEQYLRDYPSGRLVDEALYWLAQGLNRLSKDEKDTGTMIALKEEAVRRLNELIDRYPASSWANDATALRVVIARDFDHFGFSQYQFYLDTVAEKEPESIRAPRVLRSLSEITKEAAFPIAQTICFTDRSWSVRSLVAYFLGKNYRQDALPILEAIVKNDPDERVRKDILSIIERTRLSIIPVRLNPYLFTSALIDSAEFGRIQENRINLIELPHSPPGEEQAKEAILRIFNNKIGPLKCLNNGLARDPDDILPSFAFDMIYGGNFYFAIENQGLIKEPSRITGTIRVIPWPPTPSDKFYSQPFQVEDQHDNLVIMRRGKDLVMMLLQFEAEPRVRADISRENPLAGSTLPKLLNIYLYLLGCHVHSSVFIQTTQNYPRPSKLAFIDLGIAEAEIPGSGGKWILTGQLLCDQKARIFIGRQFTLTNPQGKVVAKGALVEVPAESPQAYRIK